MSGVDVVVVTRDTRELTLRCVASVLAGVRSVTVVDNASADGTADALRAAHGHDVAVIRNDTNRGYGESCNQGAARGTAPLLLILNSDVEAGPGAVGRLAAFMDAEPGHVAVGGRLVDEFGGPPQVGFAVRGFPTAANQIALLTGLERVWRSNPLSRRLLMLDFDHDRTQDAEQPAGACLMCRRADFEAVGGFDTGFYYWFEDVDLIKRLAGRGRIAYVHDAEFRHVGGASFAGWDRPEVIDARYHGLLRYSAKHHPRGQRSVLATVVAGLGALRALGWLALDRARSAAYLRASRRAAANLKDGPNAYVPGYDRAA